MDYFVVFWFCVGRMGGDRCGVENENPRSVYQELQAMMPIIDFPCKKRPVVQHLAEGRMVRCTPC
jgi:hypothetical protein